MNVLLSLLQKSTDYNQLLKAVEAKQAVEARQRRAAWR